MVKVTAAVLAILLCSSFAVANKHPNNQSCKGYFVVAEKDETTVNLNMVGLNGPQEKWYKKHGGEFPSLCLVNGDASGKRVTFVPDDNGGHYAWSANGVLSRWDNGKQDFVAIAPIHNKNRTVFTSSSTSLLKDGLKEIEVRSQR